MRLELVKYKLEIHSTLAGITIRQEAHFEERPAVGSFEFRPAFVSAGRRNGKQSLRDASPGFEPGVCNCHACRERRALEWRALEGRPLFGTGRDEPIFDPGDGRWPW